jgi:hypothetical protein
MAIHEISHPTSDNPLDHLKHNHDLLTSSRAIIKEVPLKISFKWIAGHKTNLLKTLDALYISIHDLAIAS